MADDDDDQTPEGADDRKVTRLERRRMPPPRVEAQPADVRAQKAKMMLGPSCPYVPLGYDESYWWVIDRNMMVRGLTPRDLQRNMLVAIAGEAWLEERYPRTRKSKSGDQEVYGIATDKAAASMIDACSIMGYWTPEDHLRGLGAWPGADGDLVMHRGDHLFIRGHMASLGRYGDYVYIPRRPLPKLPIQDTSRQFVASAASELLTRIDTFRWSRGTYDSGICLGWICCAILSGGLDTFRPHLWLTGELGSGKTIFQDQLLKLVFSGAGIISVTDASAAGIWQAMEYDCIPIGIDEIESSDDNERRDQVIRLIRQASSGALILRGGSHHSGASFKVASCFLCSSIVPPTLNSQDASRIVVMSLLSDVAGVFRPPFVVDRLEQIGSALTKRLADNYKRLVGLVLPAARRQMMEDGFTARLADVYGALWAAADVAVYDEFDPARLAKWLGMRPTILLRDTALAELTAEWRRCLDWLMSSRVDRLRADSDTFGDLIIRAALPLINPKRGPVQANLFSDTGEEIADSEDDNTAVAARNRLMRYGLKVVRQPGAVEGDSAVVLIVANSHRALAEIFQSSIWRTIPEAATGGGWTQVLRRAPGAVPSGKHVRFRAVRSRAMVLPIELVIELETGTSAKPDDLELGQTARPGDAPLH